MRTNVAIALLGCLICLPLQAAEAASPGAPLFEAIRAGDRAGVRALLQSGADVHVRDEAGNTLLVAASLQADVRLLELLIEAGAEVNAANKAGATALMRAATFEDKAALLVSHKADVNARSRLGNTPLLLAARRHGNAATVKLLLDRGAEVNATNVFGATALMAAVAAEDIDTVRLLLGHGAGVNAKPGMNVDGFIWGGGRTPLMWAAFRGNQRLIRLLLEHGAEIDGFTLTGSALTQAGWAGNTEAARALLDAGAKVDQRDLMANFTPLHWAASSERSDASLVELLLAHHANANAAGGQPVDNFLGETQTPLMLASKRGQTPIVQALLKSGARKVTPSERKRAAKPARPSTGATGPALIAEALQLAVPPLQRTALESQSTFHRHSSRQNCVSCHQQQLPLSAISLARSRHIVVDESAARKQLRALVDTGGPLEELDLQATFHPEPAIGNGYALFAMRLEQEPPSAFTDSQVHQLTVIQSAEGDWPCNLPRPPIQSSAIGATALAVQALKFYGIPGRQREFEERIERARHWLGAARAESNEERAYQLLGLAWAGEAPGKLKALAKELTAEQRADGGWGQLSTLASDAFATGHTLYALLTAGELPATDPAVQRGLRFLLQTQLEDGTWHVHRRAFPFQPPMESSFPHGADGWVSGAATSWAVMALASALDPSEVPATQPVVAGAAATARTTAAVEAEKPVAPVDFAREIQPMLERSCVACHSGKRPKGGFRVVDGKSLLEGGNRGEPVIVAHHSGQSPLVQFVADQVEDMEMPPLGKRQKFPALTTDELARLRAWIDQGAKWPEEVTLPSGAN